MSHPQISLDPQISSLDPQISPEAQDPGPRFDPNPIYTNLLDERPTDVRELVEAAFAYDPISAPDDGVHGTSEPPDVAAVA